MKILKLEMDLGTHIARIKWYLQIVIQKGSFQSIFVIKSPRKILVEKSFLNIKTILPYVHQFKIRVAIMLETKVTGIQSISFHFRKGSWWKSLCFKQELFYRYQPLFYGFAKPLPVLGPTVQTDPTDYDPDCYETKKED